MARLPTRRNALLAMGLLTALALAASGWLLVCDRPGLEAEYFALVAPWEGRPVHTKVRVPELEPPLEEDNISFIGDSLVTEAGFSIRWSGAWNVEREGRHLLAMTADDGGYIRVDGEIFADTRGLFGPAKEASSRRLAPGFHDLEIGVYQTVGASRMEIEWKEPGVGPGRRALAPEDLYAGRALRFRRWLRGALASWARPYRQLLGVGLLCVALALLGRLGAGRLVANRVAPLRQRVDRPHLRALLLAALFVTALAAVFPFTGSVRGGDDTAYLKAAYFSDPTGFYGRYVHVYLLKLFILIGGGDPVVAVRLWWSAVWAGTVTALAVAVRSVGPAWQIGTLFVTLCVFLAQPVLSGLAGAGFADFTAMFFVTATVAVYLGGLEREGTGDSSGRAPPRREWRALAVGALTAAAIWSKEVSALLLGLPLLYLVESGGRDLARFARRLAYWGAGAAAATLLVVVLDGVVLGDLLFHFDGERFDQLRSSNLPGQARDARHADESWFHRIWSPRGHAASAAFRNLWLAALAAAVAAGLRGRRLEIRLLHLLPIAYVATLMVLYVRMPHPISERMLIPYVPLACLMAGLLARDLGVDEVPWSKFRGPGVWAPAVLAAAIMVLFVFPYRMGDLEAAEFLPSALLARFGWSPDLFAVGVLMPLLLISAFGVVAMLAEHREIRVVGVLLGCLALFGLGVEFNRSSLARKLSYQTGNLLLYPWTAFRDELNREGVKRIAISNDVQWRYRMSATTRRALANVGLRRKNVWVQLASELPRDVDVAIASRPAYGFWRAELPTLAETAVLEPSGVLVLIRPKEAARLAAARAP